MPYTVVFYIFRFKDVWEDPYLKKVLIEMPKISLLCIHFSSMIHYLSHTSFETKILYEEGICISLNISVSDKQSGIITPERKERKKKNRRGADMNLFYKYLLQACARLGM